MICICGYACEDWEGEKEFNKEYAGKRMGQDEFIRISGTFLAKSDGYYPPMEVSLYACPECKTVQLRD